MHPAANAKSNGRLAALHNEAGLLRCDLLVQAACACNDNALGGVAHVHMLQNMQPAMQRQGRNIKTNVATHILTTLQLLPLCAEGGNVKGILATLLWLLFR